MCSTEGCRSGVFFLHLSERKPQSDLHMQGVSVVSLDFYKFTQYCFVLFDHFQCFFFWNIYL